MIDEDVRLELICSWCDRECGRDKAVSKAADFMALAMHMNCYRDFKQTLVSMAKKEYFSKQSQCQQPCCNS